MTPAEFYTRMLEIQESQEAAESKHIRMDDLMCELLESIGYSDGIEVFQKTK